MVYHLNVIQATCGSIVLLKFVESFTSSKSTEDEVVDKLKDDFCFTVRTISGHTYSISTKEVRAAINGNMPPTELAQAIYEKWKHIHQENI